MKHLQHCTGYRPPPPPQQQQQQQQQQQRQQLQRHTTAPPPTFNKSHRYTLMGGAVKRYNIDMQETQHIEHL